MWNMKGYRADSPEWFDMMDTNHFVWKWKVLGFADDDENKEINIKYFKERYNIDVENYVVKQLPEWAKKNAHDSAKLIVVKTTDGVFKAKRFINNGWFRVKL